jgi:uncharacterized RDD family membrane protein YckC
MSWYYKEGEQTIGPVSKKDLQELINAKRINGRTLVRSTETNQWKPIAELVHGKAQDSHPQPPPTPQVKRPPAPPTPSVNDGEATLLAVEICSQCGRSFPIDQVVTFGDKVICASCKPMFVQKLKEGATIKGALRFAGFWIRFGAKIIDGLIMAVVQWLILLPMGILASSSLSANPGEAAFAKGSLMLIGLQQLIGITIPAIYNTFFIGRFAATPGKMACRLKVVTPEGGKVGYGRALGRNFAEWLSAILLGIGYLMAAFDGEKRALHDRVCSTRVIRK